MGKAPLALTQTQTLQEVSQFSGTCCGVTQIQPAVLRAQSHPWQRDLLTHTGKGLSALALSALKPAKITSRVGICFQPSGPDLEASAGASPPFRYSYR